MNDGARAVQPFYERFAGSGAANELEIANQELSQLAEEAVALVKACR